MAYKPSSTTRKKIRLRSASAPRTNLSVWSPTAPVTATPALDNKVRADVCFVGAGIAGVTIAYLLVHEGSEPQKGISKEGDRYLRTMVVQGAHYILGPFGEDSDLRRWGRKLAERGGKAGSLRLCKENRSTENLSHA